MILLNSKKCFDCDEEELEEHCNEILDALEEIKKVEDYECALVCKYQDEYHKRLKSEVIGCKVSEVVSELERFDFKNGVDMFLDEEGFITFLIYGQSYTYNEQTHLIVMGVKILPFNEKRMFLDISPIIKKEGLATISTNQFE